MSAKRNDTTGRHKALDLWEPPNDAGAPLACVATTFTFDAAFFESECLGRFLQMDTDPSENGVAYLVEREEKLAAARVAVLVDRRHATAKESLRWDVLPVAVRGAAQHAKLTLLCWADHVRVVVGSGNITEPGYRKNLEVLGTLEASRSEPGAVEEVLACIAFLEEVARRALGDPERQGPKRRVLETLALVRERIAEWPRASRGAVRLVPVFGGVGASVFDQLARLWPSNRPAREAWALSPFFDQEHRSAETATAFVGLLAQRGERTVHVAASYEEYPDGKTRVMAPRAAIDAFRARCELDVQLVSNEQDDGFRPLHAKILGLANDEWFVGMIGSSNFTRAGFGLSGPANLEANLAYIVRAGTREERALDGVWPEIEDRVVDPDDERIVWAPVFEIEGEGAEEPPLPAAFREALYDTGGDGPRLVLTLDGALPSWWRILGPSEEVLRESGSHNPDSEIVIPWDKRPVPFVLQVQWREGGAEHGAGWPVNVGNPAALPPPEALRDLSLDELVDILGTTRPLHAAVLDVLRRRASRAAGAEESELRNLLDPHKRVSTETFLLRRTKRVGLALEHLRERLERPVASREALEWRLGGPVGPLALAEAFRRDARSPEEARFCLAELALALNRVRPAEAAKGGLPEDVIREVRGTYVTKIQEIAEAVPGDSQSAIARYAAAAFGEVRP